MVLARRLLLLAAVLLLLTALAAGLAPRGTVSDVTPLSPGQPAPASGRTVTKTISAAPGANTRVRVRRGDLLALDVAGNAPDTVLLERLDRLDALDPSTPAHFNLLIDEPAGDYPIRLVDADRRIGAIEIGAAAR
jgi:hypothetical protein